MKIYVLTLETAAVNYELTVKRLVAAGFASEDIIKRIGIDGVKDPEKLTNAIARWQIPSTSKDFTPVQQGNSFAHLDTMEAFLETGSGFCLIVEHDLLLPIGFKNMFDDVMTSAANYDILFLGWANVKDHRSIDVVLTYDQRSRRLLPYYPSCMHCYVITRAGAQKICHAIRSEGLTTILDVWIAEKAKSFGIRSLCVNANLYDFSIPPQARMNSADGIAFQDN